MQNYEFVKTGDEQLNFSLGNGMFKWQSQYYFPHTTTKYLDLASYIPKVFHTIEQSNKNKEHQKIS